MTIGSHESYFAGLPTRRFNSQEGIRNPEGEVYRLTLDYDDQDDGLTMSDLLTDFLEDPGAAKVKALIMGMWGYESDDAPDEVVQQLVAAKSKLPALKHFFMGDITYEENEMSWIEQTDMGPFLKAYPELETLRVRGGGQKISDIDHSNLKTLILESGGLTREVVQDIGKGHLPGLEHLELWLGADEYGWGGTNEDIKALLSKVKFPGLRYLGLKNSEVADSVVALVCQSDLLPQLKKLDFSMGTLGDEGAQILLDTKEILNLEFLDLHHHYMSDGMMDRLRALNLNIDISEQEEPDEEYRYVSVGE